jgi:putative DNA primase/helicase
VTHEHNGAGAANGNASMPRLNLAPQHLDDLRRSGLTETTILAACLQTVTDADLIKRCLNWDYSAAKLGPCLAFPYATPDGGKTGFVRVRPDYPRMKGSRVTKYESPAGKPLRLYFSPTATPEALADTSTPLFIVEGEKKTLRASQEELVAVGVAGVWGWQLAREEDDDGKTQGPRMPLPDFDLIEWSGRVVYLIFDSDVAVNPKAAWGEYHLAIQLQGRGADVRIVRLPIGPLGADGKAAKVGLDDFLLTHTADDLRVLMASAKPPEKPEPDTALEADDDPHRLARLFVEQSRFDGLLDTVRFWREEYHRWDGAAYRPLPPKEVKAELTTNVKAEFDRLNIDAQKRRRKAEAEEGTDKSGDADAKGTEKKKKPAIEVAGRVTTRLIADVTQALAGVCLLPSSVERPAWLSPTPEWDAAEMLACKNGLIHLPSLVVGKDYRIDPTPLFFSANALDYDFDLDAPKPTAWFEFLGKLWPKDPESIGTLQEWFGYCTLPDTSQQKILMAVGPRRCGKGTIARVLARMIGLANVCAPTLAGLGTNFGLWPLVGKTLGIISDARLGRQTDVALITERLLSISGEDAQTLDRKNMAHITCKLAVRFMILTNELPRLNDPSGALVGRLVLLRLTKSWYGKEDVTLTAKLLTELPSILLWAIRGWERLQKRGHFLQPASSLAVVRDMEDLSSPMGAFVRDLCVVGANESILVQELFDRWKVWCEEKGWKSAGTEQVFGRDLRAVVPALDMIQPRDPEDKTRRVRVYQGIRLKTPDDPAAEAEQGGN